MATRFAWLHPWLRSCAEFHDVLPPPVRSKWPTCADPVGVARPVLAGVIGAVSERASVRLRAGEDVVLVRLVAGAVDRLVLFGERGHPAQVVAEARGSSVSPCRSPRRAIRAPRALCQGPLPMRSRAFTAAVRPLRG